VSTWEIMKKISFLFEHDSSMDKSLQKIEYDCEMLLYLGIITRRGREL